MLSRSVRRVLIVVLAASTLLAANSAFTGKWKLNQSKSKMTGEEFKITAVGANKYTLSDSNISDTVVADGTDQPVHFGNTTSLRQGGPNVWKFLSKKNGRVLSTCTWTLAQDGGTARSECTIMRPDDSTCLYRGLIKRIAGTEGLAGAWDSTNLSTKSPYEWVIQPYGGNGLSFITPPSRTH